MRRSTRKATVAATEAIAQPPAKRTKKDMGCGAGAKAPAPTMATAVKVHPAGGEMPRADSAYDFNKFPGGFDPADLQTMTKGAEGTLDYRMSFFHKAKPISPWHDVPYKASASTYNMMCEIPKWTRAKFEVAVKEPNNPIKQDEKKGVVREYKHGDMLFNYGFMPQTWEDPNTVTEDTGYKGDDDPLDMVEVGCRAMVCGQVAEVKVIGVLAMIDDGETDWKVFCIRVDDPLAALIDDVADLEKQLPGAVSAMREWFRVYKVAEGKPENKFGLDEKCMSKKYAQQVVEETHDFWAASEEALRARAAKLGGGGA